MSGRRRSSDHEHSSEQASGRTSDQQVELDEQSLLGNQAVASRMGGSEVGEDPLALARDAALPLIDRGVLALEIESVGTDKLARFTEILERSALGADQRNTVLGRLNADELVARDVSDALRSTFGDDGPVLRDAVADSLDALVDGLREGSPTDGGWQLPGGEQVAVSPEGSRVHALIEAVGDAVGPAAGASTATGARILAFCQRVQLALLLDEEEEEIGPDYGTEEVQG